MTMGNVSSSYLLLIGSHKDVLLVKMKRNMAKNPFRESGLWFSEPGSKDKTNNKQTNKTNFSLKHCITLYILIAKTKAGCLNENFWTNKVDFQHSAPFYLPCTPSNSTYTSYTKLKVKAASQRVCKWPMKAVFFHTSPACETQGTQSHIPSLKAARIQCIPHLRLLLGWMLDFWIVGSKFV